MASAQPRRPQFLTNLFGVVGVTCIGINKERRHRLPRRCYPHHVANKSITYHRANVLSPVAGALQNLVNHRNDLIKQLIRLKGRPAILGCC